VRRPSQASDPYPPSLIGSYSNCIILVISSSASASSPLILALILPHSPYHPHNSVVVERHDRLPGARSGLRLPLITQSTESLTRCSQQSCTYLQSSTETHTSPKSPSGTISRSSRLWLPSTRSLHPHRHRVYDTTPNCPTALLRLTRCDSSCNLQKAAFGPVPPRLRPSAPPSSAPALSNPRSFLSLAPRDPCLAP
jgi:hypothetical protein